MRRTDLMMEYTNKYWKMIMPLVKKSLVKRFGKEETALLVQKTDAIYREMLNRSDDIRQGQSYGFKPVRMSDIPCSMESGRRKNKR